MKKKSGMWAGSLHSDPQKAAIWTSNLLLWLLPPWGSCKEPGGRRSKVREPDCSTLKIRTQWSQPFLPSFLQAENAWMRQPTQRKEQLYLKGLLFQQQRTTKSEIMSLYEWAYLMVFLTCWFLFKIGQICTICHAADNSDAKWAVVLAEDKEAPGSTKLFFKGMGY